MTEVAIAKELLKGPVAVLMGGQSSEREISLQTGQAIYDALKRRLDGVIAVDVDDNIVSVLKDNHIAHAFIALHGPGGEDGTIQGMLEMLGIHYTGSGVLASALGMDKLRCKQMWQGIGLPTPAFLELGERPDYAAVSAVISPDFIVKPSNEGSSIGMSKVSDAKGLTQAYQVARNYDQCVFAEQWISGPEYTVAVLDGVALPPIRLETDNEFYDYDAKYVSDETRYLCPCGLSEQRMDALQKLAIKAFDSLGCEGWGRVDFMEDSYGNFYLLEVNTVPGMTSHSLVPLAAKAAEMEFEDLVVSILNASLVSARKVAATKKAKQ